MDSDFVGVLHVDRVCEHLINFLEPSACYSLARASASLHDHLPTRFRTIHDGEATCLLHQLCTDHRESCVSKLSHPERIVAYSTELAERRLLASAASKSTLGGHPILTSFANPSWSSSALASVNPGYAGAISGSRSSAGVAPASTRLVSGVGTSSTSTGRPGWSQSTASTVGVPHRAASPVLLMHQTPVHIFGWTKDGRMCMWPRLTRMLPPGTTQYSITWNVLRSGAVTFAAGVRPPGGPGLSRPKSSPTGPAATPAHSASHPVPHSLRDGAVMCVSDARLLIACAATGFAVRMYSGATLRLCGEAAGAGMMLNAAAPAAIHPAMIAEPPHVTFAVPAGFGYVTAITCAEPYLVTGHVTGGVCVYDVYTHALVAVWQATRPTDSSERWMVQSVTCSDSGIIIATISMLTSSAIAKAVFGFDISSRRAPLPTPVAAAASSASSQASGEPAHRTGGAGRDRLIGVLLASNQAVASHPASECTWWLCTRGLSSQSRQSMLPLQGQPRPAAASDSTHSIGSWLASEAMASRDAGGECASRVPASYRGVDAEAVMQVGSSITSEGDQASMGEAWRDPDSGDAQDHNAVVLDSVNILGVMLAQPLPTDLGRPDLLHSWGGLESALHSFSPMGSCCPACRRDERNTNAFQAGCSGPMQGAKSDADDNGAFQRVTEGAAPYDYGNNADSANACSTPSHRVAIASRSFLSRPLLQEWVQWLSNEQHDVADYLDGGGLQWPRGARPPSRGVAQQQQHEPDLAIQMQLLPWMHARFTPWGHASFGIRTAGFDGGATSAAGRAGSASLWDAWLPTPASSVRIDQRANTASSGGGVTETGNGSDNGSASASISSVPPSSSSSTSSSSLLLQEMTVSVLQQLLPHTTGGLPMITCALAEHPIVRQHPLAYLAVQDGRVLGFRFKRDHR